MRAALQPAGWPDARGERRSRQVGNGQMAECPVCGAEIGLAADAVVGELMECPDCGTELEVLEVDPPELGEAPETEEDWGQ